VKIVYALPFEPVVQSRSILCLGLPSSSNGNCEWPLPVHWNCLFVSNQGAFNVSRVSSRSAHDAILYHRNRFKPMCLTTAHIINVWKYVQPCHCSSISMPQASIALKWPKLLKSFLARRLPTDYPTLYWKEIQLSPKIRVLPSATKFPSITLSQTPQIS